MAEAGASDAAADGGSGTSITLACLDSVDGQVEAVFWAFNSGSSGVDFPFGIDHRVSPGEPVQGQPWHFKGHSGDGFRVLFNGTAITWTLGSQSMTIDSGAAPCGPNVGCARESYGSTTEGLTYGPCAYCGDGLVVRIWKMASLARLIARRQNRHWRACAIWAMASTKHGLAIPIRVLGSKYRKASTINTTLEVPIMGPPQNSGTVTSRKHSALYLTAIRSPTPSGASAS